MIRYNGLEVGGFIFLENDFDKEVSILNPAEGFELIDFIEDFGKITPSKCKAYIDLNFSESIDPVEEIVRLEEYRAEAIEEVEAITIDIAKLKEVM